MNVQRQFLKTTVANCSNNFTLLSTTEPPVTLSTVASDSMLTDMYVIPLCILFFFFFFI